MAYFGEPNLRWVRLISLLHRPLSCALAGMFLLAFSFSGESQITYEEVWKKKSLTALHTIYQGNYKELPVFNREQRCHEQNHRLNCDTVQFNLPKVPVAWNKFVLLDTIFGWWEVKDQILPATFHQAKDHQGRSHHLVILEDEVVYQYEDFSSFADTTIMVKVFHPNPIVSSGANYGGPYRDNNDLNNISLELEQEIRSCPAGFETGQFILKNRWIQITDLEPPNQPPVRQAFPQFYFSRSDPRFEAVNAFYHLTNFCRKVEVDLGFSNLFSSIILVDPHAVNGADNSYYNGNGLQPQINFGQGGVDDAEDAQVVIHELGHAIADFAAPNSNAGQERKALEEGLGDYLGVSYSEALSGKTLAAFASWDGHNEFWPGRWVNTQKKYPDDFQQEIYTDGEIWSSALKLIDEAIGSKKTQQALIESLHWYSSGVTMRQAGQYFLAADSALNGNLHTDAIRSILCQRGLLSDCIFPADYSKPVTVNASYLSNGILLFSSNVDQFDHLDLFDLNGRRVASFEGPLPISINVSDLVQGFYLLQFHKGNEYQTFKVILN